MSHSSENSRVTIRDHARALTNTIQEDLMDNLVVSGVIGVTPGNIKSKAGWYKDIPQKGYRGPANFRKT
jgi:hypothetical protein